MFLKLKTLHSITIKLELSYVVFYHKELVDKMLDNNLSLWTQIGHTYSFLNVRCKLITIGIFFQVKHPNFILPDHPSGPSSVVL